MAIYTRTGDKGETGLLGGARTNKGSNQIVAIGAVDELNSHLGLSVAMLETVRMSVTGENVEEIEIGLAVTQGQLQDVQRKLFEVGAQLAEDKSSFEVSKFRSFEAGKEENKDNPETRKPGNLETDILEQWIDEMEKDLPELRNFILPGGGVVGAELMVTRAMCRRAERELVRYVNSLKYRSSKDLGSRKEGRGQDFREQHTTPFGISSQEGNMFQLEIILAYLNRLGDYLFVASRWANWLLKEEEVIWKGI